MDAASQTLQQPLAPAATHERTTTRSAAHEAAIDSELQARAAAIGQNLTGLLMCGTMLLIASGAALNWSLPGLAGCCLTVAVAIIVTARLKFRAALVQCAQSLGLPETEARRRARTLASRWWSDDRYAK